MAELEDSPKLDTTKKEHENVFAKHVAEVVFGSSSKRKKRTGISSGFPTVDRFIDGFDAGQLIVIASRPSVGKSALAVSLAVNLAFGEKQISIGFFPLVAGGNSLVEHMIACKAGLPLMKLRKGELSTEENKRMMAEAIDMYSLARNVIIQDSATFGLVDLCWEIRKMANDCGVKVVFIDGVDLIRNTEGGMAGALWVSEVFMELKLLARELGISIICLCHLNKSGAGNRAPILADIKDSDMIIGYSDIVLLLDDPSSRLEEEKTVAEMADIRKVIVAKNNGGNIGVFTMRLNTEIGRFEEVRHE